MSSVEFHFDRYLNFFSSCDAACVLAALTSAGIVYVLFLRPLVSPLSRLPGPQNESILYGNLRVVHGPEGGLRQWHKDFGPNLRFRGFFGSVSLSTTDPKALNHILVSRAYAYPKADEYQRLLGNVLGRGLFLAQGETHKRQKRLLGPTFSPLQIRELAPIAYKCAYVLRDKWTNSIRSSQKPYLVINVHDWVGRAVLDFIGEAGFGYQFGALKDDENSSELGKAFQYLLKLSAKQRTPCKILRENIIHSIPASLRFYKPPSLKLIERFLKTMEIESRSVLFQKQKEAEGGDVVGGKDLISVLVRANSMSEGKDCLSDDEVIAQMTTFILAGQDTTSIGLTWMLWILAKHPDIQKRLREELLEAHLALSEGEEQIPVEKLESLEFLDAVCRETLRFIPPVSQVVRKASMADTIPVSGNGEPIHIAAGQEIIIPIIAFNRSKDVFGSDADVFHPDRWLKKDQVNALPGCWSGLATFLGGPRICIGYRLAIMEMKIIAAIIFSKFHFEERDGLGCGPEIERIVNVVMRPKPKEERRLAMPLRVSLVEVP